MNFESTEVLGKRFRIVHKKLDGDYGKCYPKQCKIVLSTNASDEQRKDTLLHEVIHAVECELDLGLKERQVRLMATGLMGWMRANPEIVRWIMDRVKP